MFGGFVHPAAQGSASGAFNTPPQGPSRNPPQEPPLVSVTSDLPEYGGSPSPHPSRRSPTPHSAISTPGWSRLEVVLKASPRAPGYKLWQEADLDDNSMGGEDELLSSDVQPPPSKKPKIGRPVGSRSSTNVTAPNPASTSSTPQPPGKRPRGRPKGWRPGMPSTKTGKLTASAARYLDEHGNRIPRAPPAAKSSNNDGAPKRRGRPPRAPPPTPRQVWETIAAPRYVAFLCEWAGCKAELQNAETLRRHVRKVHGLLVARRDGGGEGVVCRWAGCGRRLPGEDGQVVFATVEAFHEHLEARHMVPLVWHVGDGVRNEKCLPNRAQMQEVEGMKEEIPAYLLGPDGKQVTPWVKYQTEEDNITRMRNRKRLRDILIQRDANAPLEEADEVQEGAESSVSP